MRVVCQQPNYFPWLGYFEQIALADAFVFLDDVQWIRQGRQHRARLPAFASSKTEKLWLTVPIQGHGHRDRAFREMRIDSTQTWSRSHWQTLLSLYGKAPQFHSQLEPIVRPFLEKAGQFRFLIDLCEASTSLFWEQLRLEATVWHSSHLGVEKKKTERLVEICQILEATEYYSALGSSRYLDPAKFREAGMRVRFQHFRSSAGPDPRRPCDYSI
ncbi:MAG: WbqC family protein, partial [Bdellovibrionota bacterium]